MFCSECGQKARGKFCSNCGRKLAGPDETDSVAAVDDPANSDDSTLDLLDSGATPRAPLPTGWEFESRYATLVRMPAVRALLKQHGAAAKKGISGEQFLALFDKISPLGVPLETIASIAQPLYARLGIATGKERTETLVLPIGRVLVAALCSLARRGQSISAVRQANDGCCLEAVLPSDLFSLAGELVVTVRGQGPKTLVSAATKIKGQYFDWGKSNRTLDRLFTDLRDFTRDTSSPISKAG